MLKIKLYTARKLDKKFPSGKWNGIDVIERHGNKMWWKYYGLPRFMYNKYATRYRQAFVYDNTPLCKVYAIVKNGFDIPFPEIFVKKVKTNAED